MHVDGVKYSSAIDVSIKKSQHDTSEEQENVGRIPDKVNVTLEEVKKRKWSTSSATEPKSWKVEFDLEVYVTKYDNLETELLKELCGNSVGLL